MEEKVKVLIVDDSALVRQTLSSILSDDPMLEVVGTASNPYAAADILKRQLPDVITLDIEMPRMDGLTFLRKLMQQFPIPVVIISSLTGNGSDAAIKALEFGAVDVITKPRIDTSAYYRESAIRITDVVKAAAQAKVGKRKAKPIPGFDVAPKYSADAVLPMPRRILTETTGKIIAIGASTGGTEALRYLIENLPGNTPVIIVVQHMPELFTRSFAESLNKIGKLEVHEAKDGDAVINGTVLIAPGNRHTMLRRSGARYYVHVSDGELVNRHRPSVDVLFRSVAANAGKNAFGFLLTGMGDDGARGLLEMKAAGAITIAQDESSSIVFGMPKAAISLNAAHKVLSLTDIKSYISKIGC
ncbi:MAG: chemotaxis response regulator protein-glutamate methylesterase [Cyclobacteriaceae bacterium]|nr:chemotaxis response regulator protein-glutamate methylesterase [Cyclobacteriaceae bacterium]